jgi:hypothetical protein
MLRIEVSFQFFIWDLCSTICIKLQYAADDGAGVGIPPMPTTIPKAVTNTESPAKNEMKFLQGGQSNRRTGQWT